MKITEGYNKLLNESTTELKHELDELMFSYMAYGDKTGEVELVLSKLNGGPKWLFTQLIDLIDELKMKNLETSDILNTSNWGLKPNGDLGYFDIGYGDPLKDYGEDSPMIDEAKGEESESKEIANKVTNKLNLGEPILLGSGVFGYAFKVDGDKVLKITTDRSEYGNSKQIQGEGNKHIANIYETYRYKDKFIIILELLNTSKNGELDSLYNELKDWFEAQMNKHIDNKIIDMVKSKDQLTGDFLNSLVNDGTKIAWSKYINQLDSNSTMDWNEVADVSEWIKGSKTNDHDYNEEPPTWVFDTIGGLI